MEGEFQTKEESRIECDTLVCDGGHRFEQLLLNPSSSSFLGTLTWPTRHYKHDSTYALSLLYFETKGYCISLHLMLVVANFNVLSDSMSLSTELQSQVLIMNPHASPI
jgi:hypothetical protein